MKSGADAEIVVVTHGGYLHCFTEDWTGHVKSAGEQNRVSLESALCFDPCTWTSVQTLLLSILRRYWLGEYRIQIVHFPI